MNKYLAAPLLIMAMPLAMAKPGFSIDAGAGWGTNGLADDSTLMGNTFDLTGTSNSEPYGLNMDGNSGAYAWMKLSTPIIVFIPDIKVKYESMLAEGYNDVQFTEEVFGESYDFDGSVSSELDLSHLDTTLSYRIPLPLVGGIDFGANFRSMIGGFSAEGEVSGGGTESIDAPFEISGVPLIIPMLYIGGEANIPFADVKLSGEYSGLPIGDTNVSDWNVKATWYAPLPTNLIAKLGLEVGYRAFNMEIGGELLGEDLSDYESDVSVSGIFAGATFHF
ncbi:hypothetical protein [Reinekea thalattae]|uniref:TIGR04219 family outer membrane beta-barrel protein n=1 Tax=Reinekea thalattae TaxID=2593301 RepID=A0A5C8Z8K4_9GAMM|nr:hypothetical protein [Reinekea thalattae]TXR54007.1 hypothetical protein FME95_05525 [Reinekea thalattae]